MTTKKAQRTAKAGEKFMKQTSLAAKKSASKKQLTAKGRSQFNEKGRGMEAE